MMKAKLKNHAKLLAEAIPALSGPTGGEKLMALPSTNSIDLTVKFRSDALWPHRSKPIKRNRWLHGDYKDPAYLYVHALYDDCTRKTEGESAP